MFALSEPWYVYALMPVIAAGVGYVTKLLVIEMVFAPLEFRGLGPIGWQGIVPRRAAKMAAITVDTLTAELLNPRKMFDLIDVDQIVLQVQEPIRASISAIAREVAEAIRPGLWDALPMATQELVIGQLQESAPASLQRLMGEVRDNIDQIIDLEHVVVTRLVTDKALLTKVFRGIAGKEIGFMATAGGISGGLIGCVQAAVFFATGSHLVVPLFGLATGGFTDWLALHMIFRPVKPGRIGGVFPWQGVFHARRQAIMRNYSEIVTRELITPAMVIDAALRGPMSDRLFALITAELDRALDQQLGAARPVAEFVIGTHRYSEMKQRVADVVLTRIPAQAEHAQGAVDAATLDAFLLDRMERMTDAQYEELLRPVFRDDEKIVIVVGALLGFLVGELQALLLL